VPAWVRALLTALFACAALYAVLLVGGADLLGLPLDPGSWLPIGVLNLCAACSCIGRAVYRPRERRAWALLGTGMLFSSSGYLLVTTAGQPLGTQITLLAYPALDVVLVVVRGRRSGGGARGLDAAHAPRHPPR
jgi:hypothetical protein